jgi:hypothetical protein
MQTGELVRELSDHFKGAAVIGCSTSGEIVGDEVIDHSVVTTAVTFDHTRLRTAGARIADAKSSYKVGGATAAAETSLTGLGARRPELAVLVSCVGRKLVMKQARRGRGRSHPRHFRGSYQNCRVLLLRRAMSAGCTTKP